MARSDRPTTPADVAHAIDSLLTARVKATVRVNLGGSAGETGSDPDDDWSNPMTMPGDLVVGTTNGAPARLGKGADGQVLTVDPTTHLLVWADPAGTYPFTGPGQLAVSNAASDPAVLPLGPQGWHLAVRDEGGLLVPDWFDSTIPVKRAVRVATTAALASNTRTGNVLTATANGALGSVDGVALTIGDRLLIKDESAGANHGIYTVTALGSGGAPWSLTRAQDLDSDDETVAGFLVAVAEGTVNADTLWLLTADDPIALNTTALAFAQIGAAAAVASLDDVGDVNAPSPADGDVLTWDATPGEWVAAAPSGGSGAPADATYITQTPNGTLTNEQALSALASGIVKVTTATGVLSSVAAPTGAVVGDTDAQTLTNKTFTAPTIADLTNAQHDHQDADDGGTLNAAAIAAGTIATARLGSGTADATTFLRGDQTWATPAGTDIAATIHAASSKATPVDADELALVDSAASFGLKKLTWANLKATLKTYFDTLYVGVAAALSSHNHTATAGDGGVLTNDEHDGYSEYADLATPATPASGKGRLYGKADGKVYWMGDDGIEVDLTLGAVAVATPTPIQYGRRVMQATKNDQANTFRVDGGDAAATNASVTADGRDADGAFVSLSTNTTSGNTARMARSTTSFIGWRGYWNPVFVCRMKTDPTTIASVRYWVGMFSSSPDASATPGGHYAAFRYDTGRDATVRWWCASDSGTSSPEETDSGVAIAANTAYTLRIHITATSVAFYVNDVLVATHATKIPTSSVEIGYEQGVTTLTTAARTIKAGTLMVVSSL